MPAFSEQEVRDVVADTLADELRLTLASEPDVLELGPERRADVASRIATEVMALTARRPDFGDDVASAVGGAINTALMTAEPLVPKGTHMLVLVDYQRPDGGTEHLFGANGFQEDMHAGLDELEAASKILASAVHGAAAVANVVGIPVRFTLDGNDLIDPGRPRLVPQPATNGNGNGNGKPAPEDTLADHLPTAVALADAAARTIHRHDPDARALVFVDTAPPGEDARVCGAAMRSYPDDAVMPLAEDAVFHITTVLNHLHFGVHITTDANVKTIELTAPTDSDGWQPSE